MPTGRTFKRLLLVCAAVALLASGCYDDPDWAGSQGGGATSDGDLPVVGVADKGYSATIRRTEGNVAHITGATLKDASFGQGWASGEDRTCDLADQVIKVTSQRAKYFGAGEKNENVNSDFAWLTVGIAKIAADDWKKADPEIRELFTAYTEGWNGHLKAVGADAIPDWCAGEPWLKPFTPVEVYTYARSVALLASSGAVIDMIGTAQPPRNQGAKSEPASGEGDTADSSTRPSGTASGAKLVSDTPLASNGWAIGKDRTDDGRGMLVANPHFPWTGELRFWEVHLTVPGVVDMYGVQLSGLPGVAIGFNENFGWTHTVSAGNRMTAYKLNLVPGSPTTYKYGNEERDLTPTEYTIDVLGKDGSLSQVTRTTWRSHYGPVLDFPGFGWTDQATISFRDANINNDEFITQYTELMRAKTLDDLIELNRKYTGVPLFNTIAVSKDGRAWYADTAATPNLSHKAIDAYEASLKTDAIVQIAKENGAVLLDGSDPMFEWQDVEGARDPGLVPFDKMPMMERSDYVFNANDSFWMAHASQLIEGDYSPLHGEQDTVRSPRTRENASVLDDTSATGPSGSDGKFSLKELENAALLNEGFTARALRKEVVDRCRGAEPVHVDEFVLDGEKVLPEATVDIGPACKVLANWDGIYDIDRAGPVLWREFLSKFSPEQFKDQGELWAKPFDPTKPLATPSGLSPKPSVGEDLVLRRLAQSVQTLERLNLAVDVKLGEVQNADRNGTLVPIHGGNAYDGTTNVVTWDGERNTMDPAGKKVESKRLSRAIAAIEVSGYGPKRTGYPIDYGTSFLMALHFTKDGPKAGTTLSYGNVADQSDPDFLAATQRFSKKQWKPAEYKQSDVIAATISAERVQG